MALWATDIKKYYNLNQSKMSEQTAQSDRGQTEAHKVWVFSLPNTPTGSQSVHHHE